MPDRDKAIGSNWRVFLMCGALLILTGLWRVFVPAHDYDSTLAIWLSVLVDAMLVVGMVGLYRQLSGQLPDGDGRRGVMSMVFWPALIAGIVIFAIRISGREGWATGHLRYFVE